MNIEEELNKAFKREVARALVAEDHEHIDEALFEKVMEKIFGHGGTQNAFDAPILYALLKGMA